MKRWLFAVLALSAAAGFAGLGVWQVERRAWKLELIARVEAGQKAPPERDWRRFTEYRRVRLTGTFLHDRRTLVRAVTKRGEGFWLMTPLRTQEGLVLVNRGFVASAAAVPVGQPGAAVTVTGLARLTEPGGAFLRANDPAHERWYSRDVAAIARTRGLDRVAPLFVDADAAPNPGGYPVGGLTVVAFRNNHLVYALTWFALALLSSVAAVVVAMQPRRG